MDFKSSIEQAKHFIQDVNQEVRRVTWPTSKELIGATVVVVLTTGILAGLLALYDLVISRLLRVILS